MEQKQFTAKPNLRIPKHYTKTPLFSFVAFCLLARFFPYVLVGCFASFFDFQCTRIRYQSSVAMQIEE